MFIRSVVSPSTIHHFSKETLPWDRYVTEEVKPVASSSFLQAIPSLDNSLFSQMITNLRRRPSSLSDTDIVIDDAPKLTIEKSKVSPGNGLFAKREIKPLEKVILFDSVHYPRPIFFKLTKEELFKEKELTEWDNSVSLNSKYSLTWPNFQKISCLNHANDNQQPNIVKQLFRVLRLSKPEPNIKLDWDAKAYIATRPIKKGEEIFTNYFAESDPLEEKQELWSRAKAWIS